jgi:hypothetical protein
MKTLEITQYGILPSGIHEMNMEELGNFFCGFPKSPYRLRLFETLKKYVQRLKTLKTGTALIVDGSFVMSCVEMPKDIDLILVMPKKWDQTIERIPQEYYNLLSPVGNKTEFADIHLFVAAEHSPLYHSWIRHFSNIKEDWHFMFDIPYNISKGLVRVTL